MRTASPWWFSAIFVVGLVFLFLGERPFHHIDGAHLFLSGVGLVLVVGVSALRVWTFLGTSGARRRVERHMLLCHVGALVSLFGYFLTTDAGLGLTGLADASDESQARFETAMMVLFSIGIVVSVVPLLVTEFSLGTAMREQFHFKNLDGSGGPDAAVESVRVAEMAGSGLTIALAAAFLMVTCNVAEQRNIRKDVSYFKTSSPGDSTVALVKSISEPVKVLLFFPEVNEVKREVRGYFDALARRSGNLTVEEHDRMVSAALAKEHRVTRDGTIVLVRGEKSERLNVSDDYQKARRTELREFDSKVNAALMKVVRERRVAYLTVGHGELNDPDSLGVMKDQYPDAQAAIIKRILTALNYQVKDLGLASGLAQEVPDDATVVLMLAPKTPLSDEELDSLDRYLAGGGAMLIALDPTGEATLGKLSGRLGVRFDGGEVTDDKQHVRQRGNAADRRLALTNQFSAHASTTTLSRGHARAGILLANAGHLVEVPFGEGMATPKRTHVIRSMDSSFIDLNDNLSFDREAEKRDRYNIATAIEVAAPAADPHGHGDEEKSEGKEDEEPGMRAMVFADGDLFADMIQQQVPLASALFADSIKWLGGEESFVGEIVSEKDKRIEHSKSKDALWFYSSIYGAPLLVLGLGLSIVTLSRRRRRQA